MKKKFLSLFLRYVVILIAGLGNLFIFYKLFTFPTIQIVSFFLSLFSNVHVFGSIIYFQSIKIELIRACIAGAGFYLLFILIMSVPEIEIKKRVKLLLFSFACFFVFNIIRIMILVLIYNSLYFDLMHLFLWYFVSTLLVICIWILDIRLFKIRKVPIYSDMQELIKSIKKPGKYLKK